MENITIELNEDQVQFFIAAVLGYKEYITQEKVNLGLTDQMLQGECDYSDTMLIHLWRTLNLYNEI